MNPARALQACYLALLMLQPVWHVLLPRPMGSENLALGIAATLPLLLPLRGVLAKRHRTQLLAAYLLVLYLVVAATEAWANPPQRAPALLQLLLVAGYVASLVAVSRARP